MKDFIRKQVAEGQRQAATRLAQRVAMTGPVTVSTALAYLEANPDATYHDVSNYRLAAMAAQIVMQGTNADVGEQHS